MNSYMIEGGARKDGGVTMRKLPDAGDVPNGRLHASIDLARLEMGLTSR